jgi:hypothetical protein
LGVVTVPLEFDPRLLGDEHDLAVAEVNEMVSAAKRRLAAEHPEIAAPEWRTA